MAVDNTDSNGIQSELSVDAELHRTYTSTYQVVTTSHLDGPITAASAAIIPTYGSSYVWGNDADAYAYCNGLTAKLRSVEQTRKVWVVTVTHSTRPRSRDTATPLQNPVDEPAKISVVSTIFQKPVEKDIDDKPCASSAGEPFDPVQEIDDTRYSIRIVKNKASVDLALNASYRDCVNSDNFFGNLPGTCKVMVPGTVERMFYGNGNVFYQETWEFAINDQKWGRKFYDRGFYKLNADGDGREVILDPATNMPYNQPVFLDGEGGVLAADEDPVELDEFKFYKAKPFSVLGIPTNFDDA